MIARGQPSLIFISAAIAGEMFDGLQSDIDVGQRRLTGNRVKFT
jgi:hypothetical protein